MSKATDLSIAIKSALANASVRRLNDTDYRFTGSQLPICPRKILLHKTKWMAKVDTPKSDSALQNGTMNHSIVQKWLASKKLLLGKFLVDGKYYPSPQYKDKYDIDSYDMESVCDTLYNEDGSLATYQEFRVYDKKSGFSGLIDGVVKLPEWSKWAVCDFKFVGQWSFDKFLKEGLTENNPYYYQLNSYRYLLERKPPTIKGKPIELSNKMYLIVFKDDFIRNPSTSLNIIPVKYDEDSFKAQRRKYLEAVQAVKEHNRSYFLSSGSALCKKVSDCGFCLGQHLCFSQDFKKEMKKELNELWGSDEQTFR